MISLSQGCSEYFHSRHKFDGISKQNSLFFLGTDADHKKLAELLKSIDVPADNKAENEMFEVIAFAENNEFSGAISDAVEQLFRGRNLKIIHNRRLNQVYLYGDAESLATAKALFKQIGNSAAANVAKQTKQKKATGELLLSVSMIVDAGQVGEDLASQLTAPDKFTSATIAKADEKGLLGMKAPKMAAQFMSRIRGRKPTEVSKSLSFSNTSTTTDQGFSLDGSGSITLAEGSTYLVKSEIGVSIKTRNKSGERGQKRSVIQSDITIPLNHPVILSMSSIGGVKTVIVVRLVTMD